MFDKLKKAYHNLTDKIGRGYLKLIAGKEGFERFEEKERNIHSLMPPMDRARFILRSEEGYTHVGFGVSETNAMSDGMMDYVLKRKQLDIPYNRGTKSIIAYFSERDVLIDAYQKTKEQDPERNEDPTETKIREDELDEFLKDHNITYFTGKVNLEGLLKPN